MEGNVNVKLISMLCYKKLVKMLGKSGNFMKKETYVLVPLIASCSLVIYHWIFHRVVHNS